MSATLRRVGRICRPLHCYFTMLGAIVLLFFAVTGFMLNHKSWFGLERGRRGLGRHGSALRAERAAADSADRGAPAFRGRGYAQNRFAGRGYGRGRGVQQSGVVPKLAALHKGRPKSPAVRLTIDIAALILALGSITGILLLLSVPRRRRLGLIALGTGSLACLAVYLAVLP